MNENPASKLAKKRWEGTTKEERSEHAKMMVQKREEKRNKKK